MHMHHLQGDLYFAKVNFKYFKFILILRNTILPNQPSTILNNNTVTLKMENILTNDLYFSLLGLHVSDYHLSIIRSTI